MFCSPTSQAEQQMIVREWQVGPCMGQGCLQFWPAVDYTQQEGTTQVGHRSRHPGANQHAAGLQAFMPTAPFHTEGDARQREYAHLLCHADNRNGCISYKWRQSISKHDSTLIHEQVRFHALCSNTW